MRREWIAKRADGLDGLGKMLDAFVEALKQMTADERAAVKTEIRDDAFVVYLE